jgi:tetratricopeptide (TPR) repeat protein
MTKKAVFILALILAAAIAALPGLLAALQANRVSLAVLHAPAQAALPFIPATHPRADFWNALAAIEKQDYALAAALLSPLAGQGDGEALQLLAQVYEQQGNPAAAIPIWQQSRNAAELMRLGSSAYQAGELEIARQAFQAAWEIDPLEHGASLADFYLKAIQDPAAAENILRQTLENATLSYARPYLLRRLALLLAAQERWAEAAQVYEQAISFSYMMIPGEGSLVDYYAEMAWAYQMAGQSAPAVSAIEQALALEAQPDERRLNWPTLLQAAQIYESAGQTELALQLYRRVVELNPEQEQALQALERLPGAP